jgi:hypothetical protein
MAGVQKTPNDMKTADAIGMTELTFIIATITAAMNGDWCVTTKSSIAEMTGAIIVTARMARPD